MTRAEFESWLEAKYADLLRVAQRLTTNDDGAADLLHKAVERALTPPEAPRYVTLVEQHDPTSDPGHIAAWVWMVGAIRSSATTQARSDRRANRTPQKAPGALESGSRNMSDHIRRRNPENQTHGVDDYLWRTLLKRLEEDRRDGDLGGWRDEEPTE